MHPGSIANSKTAAGRVYECLRRNAGKAYDAYALQIDAATTAVSTRISEVRAQLPVGERINVERRNVNGQPRWFYTLVIEQMEEVS